MLLSKFRNLAQTFGSALECRRFITVVLHYGPGAMHRYQNGKAMAGADLPATAVYRTHLVSGRGDARYMQRVDHGV